MLILKEKKALIQWIKAMKSSGKKIAFVPTMGALHAGHLSLINQAKQSFDLVVCSIFVNPTQFNDASDFAKYPITTAQDIQLLLSEKTDLLFLPSVSEIYDANTNWPEMYDLGFLETVLEGYYRPGHFQGVCKVVHRLIDAVQPDALVLGRKDYQQCMVISKMINDLKIPLQLIIGDTLREMSGLAMSSRNMRLSDSDKQKASMIYQLLKNTKNELKPGGLDEIKNSGLAYLKANDFNPDYFEIADANTLQLINNWDGHQKIVCLVAAFLSGVRLIDNLSLN